MVNLLFFSAAGLAPGIEAMSFKLFPSDNLLMQSPGMLVL